MRLRNCYWIFDYIADEVSNNNDGNITRNDGNINDNNNETESYDHNERKSNNNGNIPANDENTSNNNNDQNCTIITTHINGLQLPKDASITRKRKISSMTKPYQNKRISNGTSKRDMSSLKKKPLINSIKRWLVIKYIQLPFDSIMFHKKYFVIHAVHR